MDEEWSNAKSISGPQPSDQWKFNRIWSENTSYVRKISSFKDLKLSTQVCCYYLLKFFFYNCKGILWETHKPVTSFLVASQLLPHQQFKVGSALASDRLLRRANVGNRHHPAHWTKVGPTSMSVRGMMSARRRADVSCQQSPFFFFFLWCADLWRV